MSHCGFTYKDWISLGKKNGTPSAPFFKRSYAGYSVKQMEKIANLMEQQRYSVFDPMAGQAYGLSTLTWLGHDVYLNDYNPALMLLAWLRTREVMLRYDELKSNYISWLNSVDFSRDVEDNQFVDKLDYQDSWLAPIIKDNLKLYRRNLVSLDIHMAKAWGTAEGQGFKDRDTL